MKVVVLVGMIASGKSTYARNAARAGQVVVNDDAIVSMVHGGDYTLYDKSLKPLYKSIENHICTTALAMRKTVVIDRGVNIREPSRRRWIALARALDAPAVCVQFSLRTPLEHAERRFASDPRGHDLAYWINVAQSHYSDYDVAELFEEGWSEIISPRHSDIMAGVVY